MTELNIIKKMLKIKDDYIIYEESEPNTEIYTRDGKDIYADIIDMKMLKSPSQLCPKCKCSKLIVKGYYFTKTKFLGVAENPLYIKVRRLRYKCKDCKISFTPDQFC